MTGAGITYHTRNPLPAIVRARNALLREHASRPSVFVHVDHVDACGAPVIAADAPIPCENRY